MSEPLKKIFIATSSFNEDLNLPFKNSNNKKIKIIKNPLKKKLTDQQLINYAKDCDYIIAGTEIYNKYVIDNLEKLKILFRMGSGIENIDVNHLKKKNIKFVKSKVTPEIAVAELIVGYVLSFYRDIPNHDKNMKNKIWKKKMGSVLNGKTFGIIGYGKVGKHLSKILKNFGVNILVNDKKKINRKNTNLKILIKKSDIISMNINIINKDILINKELLKLFKKNCLFINTSRSEIIDNEYLFYLLQNNKIYGACMDVFDNEPYYGKYIKLKNVILTPHIGSYSREIRSAMEKEALQSILNEINRK